MSLDAQWRVVIGLFALAAVLQTVVVVGRVAAIPCGDMTVTVRSRSVDVRHEHPHPWCDWVR